VEQVQEIARQLEGMSPLEARRELKVLGADLCGKVLQQLGSARTLALLEGAEPEERALTLGTLPLPLRLQWEANEQYPERSVGRFMDPTEAVFPETMRASEAIQLLREMVHREFVTYGFVLDSDKRLVGVLVMRELLFAAPDTPLAQIVVRNPFALSPTTELQDAMRQVVTRHFPVYPVVDGESRLLGVVRGFRLFEAQAVEISAQPGTMVGVEKEERLATEWWRSFKLRHPWLQINLLTAFVAGAVVSGFQDTIDKLVILAAFLPVLAGQSGNTGCQALAVTIRGITLGDYKPGFLLKLLRKEAMLGLLNGLFVGLVAGGGMYFMATREENPAASVLSIVVVFAMMGSCIISGISGVLVPVALKRLGFDPATASSIFLTTATDVASMGMLLGLATLLVL
jgi:magnesium transporter